MAVIDRMRSSDDGTLLLLPSSADPGADAATVVRALRSRGALSWYVGGSISLIWLLPAVQQMLASASSAASAVTAVAVAIVFGLGFLVSAPVQSGLQAPGRLLVSGALLVLSFAFLPWLGADVPSLWTYVGVSVGMAALSWSVTLPSIAALAALALVVGAVDGGWSEDVLWVPAIIFSISMMMAAFAQSRASMVRLRAAQRQMESLAAERERIRMARDIHDILGHSLTVVTVKSELAGLLVDIDPARAKAEMAEVRALARGALTDVRATVAGSRAVTISGELAAARAALEAAGITPGLPSTTDAVPESRRELAGWVVREGVTNVLRHAAASVCRVRLETHEIEIADDGVGPTASGGGQSTGLSGLRERVESAGGRMSIGRSDLGGFSLKVTL